MSTSVDSKSAEVAALNLALAAMPNCGAQWWSYTVSLNAFELLIGEAKGRNVVIKLMACSRISGPTGWKSQSLHVLFSASEDQWSFEIRDQANGFLASASMLTWHENIDLLSQH
jgi:hypothetical protein